MTNKSISAVYDDDLVGFLDGLGVLSDVKQGDARCKFCRQVISLDNLVAVFLESGDIKFVCDRKPGCLGLALRPGIRDGYGKHNKCVEN